MLSLSTTARKEMKIIILRKPAKQKREFFLHQYKSRYTFKKYHHIHNLAIYSVVSPIEREPSFLSDRVFQVHYYFIVLF